MKTRQPPDPSRWESPPAFMNSNELLPSSQKHAVRPPGYLFSSLCHTTCERTYILQHSRGTKSGVASSGHRTFGRAHRTFGVIGHLVVLAIIRFIFLSEKVGHSLRPAPIRHRAVWIILSVLTAAAVRSESSPLRKSVDHHVSSHLITVNVTHSSGRSPA